MKKELVFSPGGGEVIRMRWFALSLFFTAGCAVLYAAPGTTTVVTYAGREIRLFTPGTARAEKRPLLIVLHGGLGNAAQIERSLGMNQVAERHGLLVAYLNGTGGRVFLMANRRTWNAGACCGIARERAIDDVGWIAAVIVALARDHQADPGRVYIMGHSNGAMMSYRFACERPGLVTAVIPISGTLTVDACRSGPVAVLHIHGADDDHVPVKGGVGPAALTDVNYRPLDETARIVKTAGARFELKLLPGVGHKLRDIDQAMQKNEGASLAEFIARFLSDPGRSRIRPGHSG